MKFTDEYSDLRSETVISHYEWELVMYNLLIYYRNTCMQQLLGQRWMNMIKHGNAAAIIELQTPLMLSFSGV
jgi:hypothetical protein